MPVDFPYCDSLDRRSFLKAAGAGALASVGLVGQSSASSLDDDYATVIDVAEEGAATDASESIVPLLDDLRQDDTLYRFPSGRYYMDRQLRFTGFENVGFVGDDATIVTADYDHFDDQGHGVYRLFRLGTLEHPGRRLHFEGFTVDQTAPETGVRNVDAVVTEDLVVRDVHVAGRHDSGLWGPARFAVTDPDGKGVVERFTAPDGAERVENTPNAGGDTYGFGITGIYANTDHGDLLLKDCELGPFPYTGLYAADASGQIRVEGGQYANSGVAQIRLGGTDSYVRWASVVVDDARPNDTAQRGIRIERGRNLRVLDSEVVVTAAAPNNYAISVHDDVASAWIQDVYVDVFGDRPDSAIVVSGGAGETTIYRSDVDMGVPGGYGIWLQEAADAPTVNCETVSVTGDVGDDGARSAILNERDNAEFRAVTVDQTGAPDRNALQNLADDVLVYACGLTSADFGIIDYGTGTWVESTYANATGDLPAVRLGDASADVLIKESTLPGGIQDLGCAGLRTWDNTY